MIVALRVEIVRFFATDHRGNRVMGGLHHERSEVFGALWATELVASLPLFVLRVLRRFTATDLSLRAFYWSCRPAFCLFGHGVSFPMLSVVFSICRIRARTGRERP